VHWHILFRRLLKAGDHVLDIGAHHGIMGNFCSEIVGSSGRVVCFEPQPAPFKYLSRIKRENVTCEGMAVSADNGPIELYWGIDPKADQAATIVRSLANESRLGEDIRSTLVEAITVDSYCMKNKIAPNLIKIDVEGAEDLVLRGARDICSKCRPPIYFEQALFENKISETIMILRSYGYETAISDFFKFLDEEKPSWDFIGTTDSEALHSKIISFDEKRIAEYAPMLANFIALHPEGAINFSNLGFGVITLDEASEFLTRPTLASAREDRKRLSARSFVRRLFNRRRT